MRKISILAVVLIVAFIAVPACAYNIEMLDEMTLGAKVQSLDLILSSEHVDIGAEIGAYDLTNGDTAKDSFYALGVITIKGWSIFNLNK